MIILELAGEREPNGENLGWKEFLLVLGGAEIGFGLGKILIWEGEQGTNIVLGDSFRGVVCTFRDELIRVLAVESLVKRGSNSLKSIKSPTFSWIVCREYLL